MKMSRSVSVWLVLSVCAGLQGQQEKSAAPAPASKPVRTAYYVDPIVLNVAVLLPQPPAVDSPTTKAELVELHRIEATRTPEQVANAKADEAEEDMFAFKTIFGAGFNAEALPMTAALGAHVKNEQSVLGNQLKLAFQRPRPYQTDPSLHPVCELKATHDSYPSGHSMTGYLEAFTLAEIVPEKRDEILARADDYAHNRLVCGVHYPSDVEASRRFAYVVFGYMLATPRFQHDLDAARDEMRTKLDMAAGKH